MMINLKILVADDEVDDFFLYELIAKEKSIRIDFAKSPDEVIAKVNKACAEHNCYDVVVSDINFRKTAPVGTYLTGLASAREIRRTHADTPIIFVSGYDNPLILDEVQNLGLAEFFIKPFQFDALFNKIQEMGRIHFEQCIDRPKSETPNILEIPKILREAFRFKE